jgi:hypothetical protein
MPATAQALPLKHARERRAQYPRYFKLGYAGLLAGTVVAVCLLSILYLAQTGRVATRGYMLETLKEQHTGLMREAEQYQYRIAAANQLDKIEERATKLGLRRATPAQLRYATIELHVGAVVAQR